MPSFQRRRHVRVALFAIFLAGGFANATGAAEPSATDPAAATSKIEYRSAFDGYLKFQYGPIKSWKESNETVRAVGGHMGSIRAAQPSRRSPPMSNPVTAPEAPAPAAAPVPPVTGHKH